MKEFDDSRRLGVVIFTLATICFSNPDALKRLEGKSVQLTLFKPDEAIRGIVENVTLPVQEITKYGSTMVFCTIQVRGQRQANTSEVSSLGTLGVGDLGVYRFGV